MNRENNSVQQGKMTFKYWCTQAQSSQAILFGVRRGERLLLCEIAACPSDQQYYYCLIWRQRLTQLPERMRQDLMFPGGEQRASISNDLESVLFER